MLELWLIRHGETDWNQIKRWQGHTDVPLNARGVAQAAALASRLAGQRFDGVFASDLGRTRTTAALAYPQAAAVADSRLREMNFGIFEGKSWDEMSVEERAIIDAWWLDPYRTRVPGGESFQDLEGRLVAWRRALPPQGKFLVFTHGGPIRGLLWEVLGPPRKREWSILLSNAGLTRLSYEKDRVTIISVNDCAHLEALAVVAAKRLRDEVPGFDETPAQ